MKKTNEKETMKRKQYRGNFIRLKKFLRVPRSELNTSYAPKLIYGNSPRASTWYNQMNFSHTSLFSFITELCNHLCSQVWNQPRSQPAFQLFAKSEPKWLGCEDTQLQTPHSGINLAIDFQTVSFSFCHLMKAYPLVASSGGRIGTVSRLFHPGTGSS